MTTEFFNTYFIIINVIGFILFAINTALYTFTPNGQIDSILTIVSLIGGSLGIVLSILVFDREAKKGNMMSRVFVYSILGIQIVILLVINGIHKQTFTLAISDFFKHNKLLSWYLIGMNIITFITYGIDKFLAIKHYSRIKIVTLLVLAFMGGSIGGLLAVYLFKHKTKKDYFTVGLPLIITSQIVILVYIMNIL